MTDFDFLVNSDAGVARIDLNRPDEGNILNRAMMFRLADTVHSLASNEDNKVIVIEARGEHFCRGRDGRGETTEGMKVYEIRKKMMGATLGVYEAISAASIPVVALVRGNATGFGAALAGACDITLAQSGVQFSFPEIKHEIPPTMAIAAIKNSVPLKALSYLIYSGGIVDANDARTFGLVSAVFAPDQFEKESAKFLSELATRSRLILETVKKYQLEAAEMSSKMATEYAGTLMAVVRN